MPIVEMPNGDLVQFPDGMTDREIRSIIRSKFPDIEPRQSYGAGMLDAVTSGMAGGLGPVLTGAEAALLGRTPEGDWFDYSESMGERYRDAVEAERQQNRRFREENPVSAAAGTIGGTMATMGGLATRGITGANALRSAGMRRGAGYGGAAIEGGALGATYAAGAGEDIGTGAAMGAALGPVAHGAAQGISRGVGRALRRRQIGRATQSADDIRRNEQRPGYQAAAAEEVAFTNNAYARLYQNISRRFSDDALDPQNNPRTVSLLRTMRREIDSGANPTLQRLENLRKKAGAGMSAQGPDRASLGALRDAIDEFFDNAGMGEVIAGGNKTAAVNALRGAREATRRMKKTEIIERALEMARNDPGNADQILKREFRNILNRVTRGSIRKGTFTAEEMEAIGRVANSGMAEGALRTLGKFGFNFGGGGGGNNMLGGSLGVGGATALGGPVAGIGMNAAAAGARSAAGAIRQGNAEYARGLAAMGGNQPPMTPLQRYLMSNRGASTLGRAGLAAGIAGPATINQR